jgi:hypothetical protein
LNALTRTGVAKKKGLDRSAIASCFALVKFLTTFHLVIPLGAKSDNLGGDVVMLKLIQKVLNTYPMKGELPKVHENINASANEHTTQKW